MVAEAWTKIKQTVDTSVSDREYVETFVKSVDDLAGMVQEMFVTAPALVLSPMMRRLIVEKAKLVEERLTKLKGRLVVDNPGDNFK